MGAPASPLAARRSPRQRRAVATLGRILDACAGLLEGGGLEAVTTNAIARHAGVNVATLYAYFPNKYAVLYALGGRFDARRSELIRAALDETTSWEEALEVGLDGFVALVLSEPGSAALLDAIKTCPELQSLDGGVHAGIADALAIYLRRQGIGRTRARTMARVLVEASSGVVGLARRSPPTERRRVLKEHKMLVRAYLKDAGL